eukprot:4324354-Karenia_brevis.AAC.1
MSSMSLETSLQIKQWQRVAPLLDELRSKGMLDLISFTRHISSRHEKSGQWQLMALDVHSFSDDET